MNLHMNHIRCFLPFSRRFFPCAFFLSLFVFVFVHNPSIGYCEQAAANDAFHWELLVPGFSRAYYTIDIGKVIFKPQVILLRFHPDHFSFRTAPASELGAARTDIKQLTQRLSGVAGINANFFDEHGQPIGLVVVNGTRFQNIHQGGNVLTGIFTVENGIAHISHRSEFRGSAVSQGLQAGPRLISNSQAIRIASANTPSRRSGVAITRSGEVIIFATSLRFPGATLSQIQNMLLHPSLNVTQALNFDGGGSSQLYVAPMSGKEEIFLSGGDSIPVGLVVKEKLG